VLSAGGVKFNSDEVLCHGLPLLQNCGHTFWCAVSQFHCPTFWPAILLCHGQVLRTDIPSLSEFLVLFSQGPLMMAALQLCFVMVYTSGLLTTVYSHSLYLMASCFEILQFCHFETQQSFCSWSQDLLRKDLPEFTYKALESNEKRSSLTTPPHLIQLLIRQKVKE
jgi:hypothetical protein